MEENSIEEAIERLEKGINDIWFSTTYSQEQEEKDLEILLSDYKRVLKELEELKDTNCLVKRYFKLKDTNTYLRKENEELKIVKSAIQTLQINSIEDEKYIVISKSSFLDGSYKHLLDEYIPIQEVKDKIEELKEQYNVREIDFIKTTQDIRKIIIQSLEELIEGKN